MTIRRWRSDGMSGRAHAELEAARAGNRLPAATRGDVRILRDRVLRRLGRIGREGRRSALGDGDGACRRIIALAHLHLVEGEAAGRRPVGRKAAAATPAARPLKIWRREKSCMINPILGILARTGPNQPSVQVRRPRSTGDTQRGGGNGDRRSASGPARGAMRREPRMDGSRQKRDERTRPARQKAARHIARAVVAFEATAAPVELAVVEVRACSGSGRSRSARGAPRRRSGDGSRLTRRRRHARWR